MLGSRNYSTSLDMWSVGCIFVEMVCGAPAFPGVKDTTDQLDEIFRVFGTPPAAYLEQYQSIESFNCKCALRMLLFWMTPWSRSLGHFQVVNLASGQNTLIFKVN